MFCRGAFNVYAHNRDDHTRNHAFLMEPDGEWKLAPAYDLTYSEGRRGEHQLVLAGEGRQPGAEHLYRLAADAGIREAHAAEIIDRVREACGRWPEFAKGAGLEKRDWKPIFDVLAHKD